MVTRLVRDFGGLRIETTDWPILLLELPDHRVTDTDLQLALAYIEQVMRECRDSREWCAQVTDATKMNQLPSASQRKFAGEWSARTSELQKTVSVGGANVTPSAIIRGIVTAIHWFHKPPTPVAFFATRSEAMLQAIEWLEQARSLPVRLQQMRERLVAEARPGRERSTTGRR